MAENMVFVESEAPDKMGPVMAMINTKLSEAIEQRAMAKDLEEQAKLLKDIANETILSLAKSYDITKAESSQGTIQIKHGSRTTYDTEAAKTFLVERGVAAVLVTDAFQHAQKITKFESVDFRLPKKGKG